MNVTAKDQVHLHITESTGQVGGTGKWSARVLAGCRDKVVMNDKKTESTPFSSLESLTSQCYGLCAPNPLTKARVRNSAAPSYDRLCPLRRPLIGTRPAQGWIDGRNTTYSLVIMTCR